MPEPTVTVKLSLDDSQLQEGARKAGAAVKTALGSADGNKASEAFEKLGRSAHDSSEHVRRHGDAAREAREKMEPLLKLFERGKEQVTDFGKELKTAALSFIGLAGAFEMVKRALEQGAAAEATRVRFQNLIGTTNEANAAYRELQAVAKETSTPMSQVAATAESLAAAGDGIGQVAEEMGNLAKIAKITGTPLTEIGDLLERIRLHGDVTFRELFRLTRATGGATAELARQYRDIPRELELIKTATEAASKIQQTAFEAAEKWHSAIEQVAQKGGLLDAVFKQFQAGGGLGRLLAGGLMGGGATFMPTGAAGLTGFGPWGIKAGRELMMSFNEGIKQVSSETGMSIASVGRMIQAGLLTAEDLLEKAKERREAIEHLAQASMEASRAMVEAGARERQIAILDQVGEALQRTGDIAEKFGRVEETLEAKLERASMEISRGFTRIGLSMKDTLLPALNEFGSGNWMGVIQKLPWWLDAIGLAFAGIQAKALLVGAADVIKGIGAAAEWTFAKLGGVQVAEEELAAAEAQASAAATTQAGAAAEAAAGKAGQAAAAHEAAVAEGELAAAETGAAEAAVGAAAAAEKVAVGVGAAAAAMRGGIIVGLGWLAMLKDEIDALTHLNTSLKEQEQNVYASSNFWRKLFGLPQIQLPEALKPYPTITSEGAPYGPVLERKRADEATQARIAATKAELMGGVPAGLTDPKGRELVDHFAGAIANMKDALERHDTNAARQAAADIEREAGRVGLRAGLLPADQKQAFSDAVSLMYRGLTDFIEHSTDLPKDMQPVVEGLQDAADAWKKALEPPLGREEFYPKKPPGEPGAGAEPAKSRDTGEERRDEDIKGRVRGAYAKWFYSRGEAARQAEIELRSEMEDAAAHGVQPFARGGIVRHPTVALIGEAGPEAVIPLPAMTVTGHPAMDEGEHSLALGEPLPGHLGAGGKWVEAQREPGERPYLGGFIIGGDVGHAIGAGEEGGYKEIPLGGGFIISGGDVGGPAKWPRNFEPGRGRINPITGRPTFLTGEPGAPQPGPFTGQPGLPGHPGTLAPPPGAEPMPGQPGWYHFPGAPGSFRIRPVGSDVQIPGLSPGGPRRPHGAAPPEPTPAPTAAPPTHRYVPPGAEPMPPLYGPGHARYGAAGAPTGRFSAADIATTQALVAMGPGGSGPYSWVDQFGVVHGGGTHVTPGVAWHQRGTSGMGGYVPQSGPPSGTLAGWGVPTGMAGMNMPSAMAGEFATQAVRLGSGRFSTPNNIYGFTAQELAKIAAGAGAAPPAGTLAPSGSGLATGSMGPSGGGGMAGGGAGGFGETGAMSTTDEGVAMRLDELLSIFRTS